MFAPEPDHQASLCSVEDGVLIHFGLMKNITYNSVKDTVTLQPGVRWAEATNFLAPFGVAAAGGRLG